MLGVDVWKLGAEKAEVSGMKKFGRGRRFLCLGEGIDGDRWGTAV